MKIFTFFFLMNSSSLSSKTHILSLEKSLLTLKLSLRQNSLSLSEKVTEKVRKEEGRGDLATDDGDGGKRFPERRESVVSAAIVTEHSTRSLNPVHQSDQTLHRRHILSTLFVENKARKISHSLSENIETLDSY